MSQLISATKQETIEYFNRAHQIYLISLCNDDSVDDIAAQLAEIDGKILEEQK
jgi:hypothetical protein